MIIDIQSDTDIDRSIWGNFEPLITKIVENILQTELKVGQKLEVSILLTDDNHIRQLNQSYRGQSKPTNVLSFPLFKKIRQIEEHPLPEIHLGDIVVSLNTIQREAVEQKKAVSHHLIHMIVHGILHLLGYDHLNDNDAVEMEKKEINYLAELGISNPYTPQEQLLEV